MAVCLHVDMTQKKIQTVDVPRRYEKTAGRAFVANFCVEKIDPFCYPLGEKNKLIITPGLLSQTDFPFAGRITIGAKSPLTQGVAAANGGGRTAGELAKNGIKAVIIEGLPAQDKLYILEINGLAARLVEAENLRGKGVGETVTILKQKYGKEAAITCIGPAGEMLPPTAAIANLDENGHASCFCGRGGLGAVMGAKRIKAVVVTGSQPRPERPNKPMEKLERFLCAKLNAPSETSLLTRMSYSLGKTTPHNASILIKPGTVQAFKTYCQIADSRQHMLLNSLINELGLDTLETAAAIGIFMEAEIIPWGDGEAAYALVKEVKEGSSLGLLLAQGSRAAAEPLGLEQNPHFKQIYPDYILKNKRPTPESLNDNFCAAQVFASEHIGALKQHLRPPLEAEGEFYAVLNCLLDSLGLSLYTGPVFLQENAAWDNLLEAINYLYGWNLQKEELINLSSQALRAELKFNTLAGYTGRQNYLGGQYTEQRFYRQNGEAIHNNLFPQI